MYFLKKGTPVSTSSLNTGASGSVTSGNRSLRNDLLVAADSVTNAMSSLVKELNSGKLKKKLYKLNLREFDDI